MSYNDALFGVSFIFALHWAFGGFMTIITMIGFASLPNVEARRIANKPKNKISVCVGFVLKFIFLILIGLNFYFANFWIMCIMIIQFVVLLVVTSMLKSQVNKYKD